MFGERLSQKPITSWVVRGWSYRKGWGANQESTIISMIDELRGFRKTHLYQLQKEYE